MTTEAIKQHTGNSILELCAMTDRTLLACGINPNLIRTCQFETQESVWGACDGEVCLRPATVFDRVTDHEYCAIHFKMTVRRTSLKVEVEPTAQEMAWLELGSLMENL